MALPISVTYTFATATSAIPLSQLDSNFTTVVNAINGIGNGTNSLSNVSITGGTITGVSVTATGVANGTSNVSIASANGNITTYAGGNLAMTVDTNKNASLVGTLAMGSSFLRNRIINGAMVIDQRNAGASVTVGPSTGSLVYTVDRWGGFATSTRTFTAQQSSTAPSGFTNSELLTVGVSGSPSASEQIFFNQYIEGFNVADLGWGSASAQTVTISFWVRSSVTGTYGFGLSNSNGSRTYPTTYTINSANTWEQKTITIAGDTSGTWLTNNGIGVIVRFDLGSGSNFNGTANTWSGGYYWRTSSCVNWIANAGATFYITGVQLEVGSVATPFEQRQYGQEFLLCQRYYQEIGKQMCGRAETSSLATLSGGFAVPMRAAPTATLITTANALVTFGASAYTITSLAGSGYGSGSFHQSFNSSGMTVGNVVNGFQDRVLGFSAEL